VKTTLPPESLAYLEQVEQTLFVGIKPYKDYRKFREIINRINEAALKRRTIDMIYRTMSRGGEESRRRVDPCRILFFDGTFYLIGWCHLRKGVRMFVLDRIKMLSMTDETFEVPGDFDLETYMRSPFRVIHDRPWRLPSASTGRSRATSRRKSGTTPEDRAAEGRLDYFLGRGRGNGRGEALGPRLGQARRGCGTGVPPAGGSPGAQ